MECLFGHKWNGCRCEKCGKQRDEQYDWDTCTGRCKRCQKYSTNAIKHEPNSFCKCSRCGKDLPHTFQEEKCEICGFLWEDYFFDCWQKGAYISIYDNIRVDYIKDQQKLFIIAKNADIFYWRKNDYDYHEARERVANEAIRHITDIDLLRQLLELTSYGKEEVLTRISEIDPKADELFVKIAMNDTNYWTRTRVFVCDLIKNKQLKNETKEKMPGKAQWEIKADEARDKAMYDMDVRGGGSMV